MNQVSYDPYTASVRDIVVKKNHVIGPASFLKQKLKFQSHSASGATLSGFAINRNAMIDKRFMVEINFNVVGTALSSTTMAPRAFPLNSIITQCQITINGQSDSCSPQDLIHPLSRYNTSAHFRSKYYGSTPSMLDPTNSYGTSATGLAYSPFAPEGAQSSDYETPRSLFPFTGTAATSRDYVFREPLLHGLLGDSEEEALCNVNDFQINLTFDSNLTKLWSANEAAAVAGLAVTVGEVFLHICYRIPQVPLPPSIDFPYIRYQLLKHDIPIAFNPNHATLNTQKNINFGNIILGQVPSKIYIWAKEREGAKTHRSSDGFLKIDKIRMTVGSKEMFQSLDTADLYKLSLDNGLDGINFRQWNQRLGGVLCIDVAKDICGLTPGDVGSLSINFDIDLTDTTFTALDNSTSDVKLYSLFFLAIQEGVATITPDSMSITLGHGIADTQEALSIKEALDGGASVDPESVAGAGFMGGMYGSGRRGFGVSGGKLTTRGFFRGLLQGAQAVGKVLDSTGMLNNPKAQAGLGLLNSFTAKGRLHG